MSAGPAAAESTPRPAVDVVVVTYNSRHVVEDLLASLPAAMVDRPYRTVVVDNGSSDGTPALLADRDDCLVVAGANVGYAAGINRGVAELAGTGPILVLNPDVRLAPGSVPPLLDRLRDDRVGVVAPRVLEEDGSLFASLRREPTLGRAIGLSRLGRAALSEKVEEPAAYEAAHTADWALGAALLVSRACHDRLGGWDESYFLYSEETDFCLRARDLGLLTVYEPGSECTHLGGGSGRSGRTHAMQAVNRVRLYRRRNGAVRGWAYLLLNVASEASWLARGKAESKAAIAALLRPSKRPPELRAGDSLLPR